MITRFIVVFPLVIPNTNDRIVMKITRNKLDNIKSDDLLSSYTEHGFTLFENVITEDEQKEILEELARFNRGDYNSELIDPVDWELSDKRLKCRYMYVGQPHAYSTIIKKYITNPNICKILDIVVGATVPYWDGSYKCMQTMFVSKKPGSNGSPWHQDEASIPTRDRSLTAVWIPLVDVNTENGCLWILPESHKSGIIYERFPHNIPDVDSMPISRGFDPSGAVPVEMQAGSALVFSGYLLHNSNKNVSDIYRPTLSIHYCSFSTLIQWDGVKDYRGIVPVRGQDPYEKNGYVEPEFWVCKE